jgi:hypothetical protein
MERLPITPTPIAPTLGAFVGWQFYLITERKGWESCSCCAVLTMPLRCKAGSFGVMHGFAPRGSMRNIGLRVMGEVYDVPNVGQHYYMQRDLARVCE